MKKTKLLRTLLIPALWISTITPVAIAASCGEVIHVTGVTLNKKSTALNVGDTETLTATISPEDATDKSVTWSSSNESVATVNQNGEIKALKEGNATITVKTNDGGKTDTCEVNVIPTQVDNCVCLTANENSTLELENSGGNNPNLKYSTDGENWTIYSEKLTISKNQKLYLRGDNPGGWSQSEISYTSFKITGDVSLFGSVMGLIDNGAGTTTTIPNECCFEQLFAYCDGITSVDEGFLPATTMKNLCYHCMFAYCSLLKTAPALPATELADVCYYSMFGRCTSLTQAPELPATNLSPGCYMSMFYECTSLTQAPDLPAENLNAGCYMSMFQGCTSLTQAPDLMATTLVELCYSEMFSDCSSLNSIKIGYEGTVEETAPIAAFLNWVNSVAASGTFYYKGSDTLENFGFPETWSIQPY